MKYPLIILSLTLCLSHLSQAKPETKLTVYAYDSFSGKGTLGEWLKDELKKRDSIRVEYVSFGSAGEALNQIALEKEKTRADLVVGIDNSLLHRARDLGLFQKMEVTATRGISPEFLFDKEGVFLPFDYGYLAFVCDTRRTNLETLGLKDFRSLADKTQLRKKVVIEDPRTSSIGWNFLLWTKSVLGSGEYSKFWQKLSGQLLTISPGWSGAYGLFLKGEADVVLSYTTSPAYHLEKERNEMIKAIPFSDGHYRQIEGIGLTKTTKQRAAALKYVEVLLGSDGQKQVPLTQWMYPVRENTPLPESFHKLIKVEKAIEMDPTLVAENRAQWLRDWTTLMAGVP